MDCNVKECPILSDMLKELARINEQFHALQSKLDIIVVEMIKVLKAQVK